MNMQTTPQFNKQKFIAPTLRQAMEMVKKTLGNEALIHTSRKIDDGFEIEATAEMTSPISSSSNTQAASLINKEPNTAIESIPEGSSPSPIKTDHETPMDKLQEELHLLRQYFETQLNGLAWQQQCLSTPAQSILFKLLIQKGFYAPFVQELLRECSLSKHMEYNWNQIHHVLLSQLKKPNETLLEHGGRVALIGPTGVGKTTTIAKLAARFSLEHGAHQVALINLDTFRVAAQEQLTRYGNLLKIPVRIAHDANELSSALTEFQDRKLVLIDTAGISPKDKALSERLSLLSDARLPIYSLLVFPANRQYRDLMTLYEQFNHSLLTGGIITKVDETDCYGPLLSMVCQTPLPIHFVCDGQAVPEALSRLDPEQLVSEALCQCPDNEINEQVLAHEYAEGALHVIS